MTPDDLTPLEDRLGHRFQAPSLLVAALTHCSFVAERREREPDNQRLEFLGDAVLQVLVSDLLYTSAADMDEGGLTKTRSVMVSEGTLAELGRRLGLGEWLRLGKGEERTGGRERTSVLADAFEAVVAAVYVDGGLAAVRLCCEPLFRPFLADPLALLADENPKGALQEYTQERLQVTPGYEVVNVSGPEHSPEFEVRVSVAGRVVAAARAGSRKNAEKQAARQALQRLREHGLDAV